MPLPFLRLPDLIKTQVLLDLEPFDFFSFSLISSKTKSIAASSNKKIDKLNWDFQNNEYSLLLRIDDSLSFLKVPIRIVNENFTILKFNGETLPMWSEYSHTWFIGRCNLSEVEKKKLFEKISDHIVNIFKVKDYSIRGNIFLHKEFVTKHTKKLKKITMYGDDLRADFPNILEEFSVDEFEIRGYPRRTEFNGPLKVKVLESSSLEWLSDETLASLKCQKVIIRTSHFRDLGRVVRAWQTGGMKNLEEFRIEAYLSIPLDLPSTLEGLQLIDENSYRIQREDGTTAIVAMKMLPVFHNQFVMTVEK